jgi:HSP20 family protein
MMQDEFQSLFDRFLGGWPMINASDTLTQNYFPRHWDLAVEERDKEVVFRAELPGFEVKNIDVHFANNVLTIEARKEVHGGKEGGEQQFDHVRRSFTLPAGLDADNINANYRNGILEIQVPRLPENHGRRIEVTSTGPPQG